MRFTLAIAAAVIAVALSYVEGASIDHDKVQPFAQPAPVTLSEKAAIKFKPSLFIAKDCCHPYPAVNAAGETSGGLKPTGKSTGGCTGSALGSQVYGRATWHKDKWAIMYAWYFPKHQPIGNRHRHKWVAAIVWIDNPALEKPEVFGVSVTGFFKGYTTTTKGKPKCSYRGCDRDFGEYMNGTSPMISYEHGYMTTGLDLTTASDKGEFQDLIMWEQLTNEARTALANANFGAPFIDEVFDTTLNSVNPPF